MAGSLQVPKAAQTVGAAISGDNPVAQQRRQKAYDRWFHICTCGHDPDRHDEDRFPLRCTVKDCDCTGYDHITGKPDHILNPLAADDPRRAHLLADLGALAGLDRLLAAVKPFTVDGGVGCGTEEVDALVEAYEQIVRATLNVSGGGER